MLGWNRASKAILTTYCPKYTRFVNANTQIETNWLGAKGEGVPTFKATKSYTAKMQRSEIKVPRGPGSRSGRMEKKSLHMHNSVILQPAASRALHHMRSGAFLTLSLLILFLRFCHLNGKQSIVQEIQDRAITNKSRQINEYDIFGSSQVIGEVRLSSSFKSGLGWYKPLVTPCFFYQQTGAVAFVSATV